MPYYSVQLHYRMEVCVKAKDEAEAEDLARNASFMGSPDLEEIEAEEEYNDPSDQHFVDEFKEEGNYAE